MSKTGALPIIFPVTVVWNFIVCSLITKSSFYYAASVPH